MSSTSMPPPPSPLAHRRTRLNPHPESSCHLRKMSLSKGATFHVASSPSSDADPVLSIPHLTRRSPTCSHSSLANLLSEKRELAAQSIADFEQTFSGARGNSLSRRRRSAQEFDQKLNRVRPSLPTDEGLGSSIGSPASEQGISKSLARVELASNKDSGLGESLAGSVVDAGVIVVGPEEDSLVVARDLIQDTDNSDHIRTQQPRRAGNDQRLSLTSSSHITTSYLPSHPPLSRFARRKITELLIQPILREEKYKDFHSLVNSLARRTSKNLRCLRDLEQSLIFQPLTRVSSLSSSLYRSFGELTVQLTVDTYQHLSESDQRRATDQPYSNGYFLDLVQQVERLASHIGSSSRSPQSATETTEEDAPSADDEVTLEGGLGSTGEIAELVRWRNGKGISLRTGLPYEPLVGIKRQHSSMAEEEIARSMARRKKGWVPDHIEMKCSDPTCDKSFTRKCDLAKHEKTHSRPFKCPHENCKYHELGLPTEKEKERHINDKHDPNPRLYHCRYCEFKTKRESNCKQHMEKKHNWEYKRAKGKDKDTTSTPAQTPHTPAMDYSPAYVEQSPAIHGYHAVDDASSISGSMPGSAQFTPYDEPINDFSFNTNPYSTPLFPRQQQSQPTQFIQSSDNFAFEAPLFNTGYDQFGYVSPVSNNVNMTPATPAYSTITGQSPYMANNNNHLSAGPSSQMVWKNGFPTPESAGYYSDSRHASIQYDSPLDMERTLSSDSMMDPTMTTLPQGDFALFGAFSNPAAANETLFPASDSQFLDQLAKLDGMDPDEMEIGEVNGDFEQYVNFDNSI